MDDLHHIREIESVWQARGQGQGAARDPVVVESWLRCLNQHGLDPAKRAAPHIVTDAELREHRQRSEDLVAIARSGIERLYALVGGQNYVLMLSDNLGVTVEYLGDEAQKTTLRRGGLYIGAEWSESRAGTCAVGACLESGEPLIIHQTDHFDVTHGALSCTAAPVYDTQGGLVAALDISLLSSPLPRASQSMALNLVKQAVRRIEMANIMAENRREWVLRLAGSPDFLDVDPEAAISLDGSGRIIGATHGAMRILTGTAGIDWRRGGDLIGRPVSDFLNVRLDRLDDLTRDRAAAERLIETRDGHRLFAHAIEPRPTQVRPTPTRAPAVRGDMADPLRGLAGDDPQMADLLARAASVAGSRLPILITGETGTGKLTLARALHQASHRAGVMVLSCADLADPESDAQLFGRLSGRKLEPGLLAELDGGTLILQNIDELPARLQSRLSRLLSESSFVPLGGLRPMPVDLRVIATSQIGADALIEQGRLRADFCHRLSGATFALPRLAERQDLLWLADAMICQAAERRLDIPPEVMRALAAHPWPGNLRELGFLARRLAALGAGSGLVPDGAFAGFSGLAGAGAAARPAAPSDALVLERLLKETRGNVSACARRLGVDRSTIHRRIRRYGLDARGG